MAIGSTLAGVARVAVEVDTGTSEQKLAEFDRRFVQTTGAMNEGAIRVELASRRLQRTLAQYPTDSDKALRATLALKAAQRSAAAETSTLTRKTHESAGSFRTFAHDVERGGLGLAAGTRAVKGLRSALLFGGVGFASGFGISTFLRSARDAALDQQVALGQLQAALHAAGLEQSAYTGTVKEAIDANERLGFSEEDSARSLSLAVRATKDVEAAHRLQSIAADVARGRNMNLVAATQLLVRVQAGQVGSLRRLGIEVEKGISGAKALDAVQRQYAGAATTYADSAAGAQDRLNIAVHKTEETVGTALLPTITSLNTRLSNWLDNSRNQERIQHDVNSAVETGTKVAHDLEHAWQIVGPPVRLANRLLGGTAHSIEILAGALAALKLRAFARDMGLVAGRTEAAGAAAAVSAGEFDAMAAAEGRAAGAGGRLSRLRLLGGALGVGIAAEYTAQGGQALSKYLGTTGIGSALGLGDTPLPKGVSFNDVVALKKKLDSGNPLSDRDRRVARALGVSVPDFSLSATKGAGPHGAALLGSGVSPTPRRPLTLQGRFNIAALRLAEAGGDQQARESALNDELAIVNKQIAREKNLAKKTDLVNERNGIRDQIQQITDDRAKTVADAARKRKEAQQRRQEAEQRIAKAAETRRFGRATDVLQRLSARAGIERGRGQFDAERQTLRAEEHDLELYVKDATLSVAHRRQLKGRLDRVRQQIDDIGRQIRAAAAKHAAARDARQELLIQRAEAAAALTDEKDDDLRAYRAEEKLVNRKIAALSRLKHLTNQQLQDQTNLLQQKKQIEDQIKGLAGSGTSGAALARELRDAVSGLAQYAPNVTAALAPAQGGTVVHQHLHFPGSGRPTQDYNQEMIFSRHALTVAFDG